VLRSDLRKDKERDDGRNHTGPHFASHSEWKKLKYASPGATSVAEDADGLFFCLGGIRMGERGRVRE